MGGEDGVAVPLQPEPSSIHVAAVPRPDPDSPSMATQASIVFAFRPRVRAQNARSFPCLPPTSPQAVMSWLR